MSGKMHYSGNVPGNEHILATKVLMPHGGGGVGVEGVRENALFIQGNEHILATKVGDGGSGHMHYLANVPKKVFMPSNIPECHAIFPYLLSVCSPVVKRKY